jgi:hypothetical protein
VVGGSTISEVVIPVSVLHVVSIQVEDSEFELELDRTTVTAEVLDVVVEVFYDIQLANQISFYFWKYLRGWPEVH